MSNKPANLTVERVATRLHQIFDGLIVVPDDQAANPEKAESLFRTRAYMALSLLQATEATPSDAANAVTDAGDDGGIDCIFISDKNKRIYLGQSKFSSKVDSGVALSEFNRFRDGVKNVLNQKWTRTNTSLHRFKDQIESMLKDIDTTVVMLFAHTSGVPLSDHIVESRDGFLGEQNNFEDFISFAEFTLDQAATTARKSARPENINVQLMLKGWGLRKEPYKAIYGAIPAQDIVRIFSDHGQKLFSENLRFGIEKSEVNDAIRATAKDEPGNFWYFNNGITAICEDFKKAPAGGESRDSGVFDVSRISIINGAQTVSSLARAADLGADLGNADVHIRIISLTDTPEDMATDITTANNTQNDLSPVDFVAADTNQDRIRREALSMGQIYTYRRGEPDPRPDQGFTVRDATVAAACASGDIRLAVAAKRYISGLWENTSREPYTRLFNDETDVRRLSNAVKIMRTVDDQLAIEGKKLDGRDKLISVHANRFLLFTVFQEIAIGWEAEAEMSFENLQVVRYIAGRNLAIVIPLVNDLFSDGYPGNVFKNRERQEQILLDMNAVLEADRVAGGRDDP